MLTSALLVICIHWLCFMIVHNQPSPSASMSLLSFWTTDGSIYYSARINIFFTPCDSLNMLRQSMSVVHLLIPSLSLSTVLFDACATQAGTNRLLTVDTRSSMLLNSKHRCFPTGLLVICMVLSRGDTMAISC